MGNFVLSVGNNWLSSNGSPLYMRETNPLNLPPFTMRWEFSDTSYNPTTDYNWPSYVTWTQVSASPNIWDFTKPRTDWHETFYSQFRQMEYSKVLGANMTGVTNMYGLFASVTSFDGTVLFDTSTVTDMSGLFGSCRGPNFITIPQFDTRNVTDMSGMFSGAFSTSNVDRSYVPLLDTSNVVNMAAMFSETRIRRIPLFNTANVTDMTQMFADNQYLQDVPLLDTSSVTSMDSMFVNCYNVERGALALYQQASSQAVPPQRYGYCFWDCGKNTVTGLAELNQIPTTWGGRMST